MSLPGTGKRMPSPAHPNPRLSPIVVASENAMPVNDFFNFDNLVVDASAQSDSTATNIYFPNEGVILGACSLGVADGECAHGVILNEDPVG